MTVLFLKMVAGVCGKATKHGAMEMGRFGRWGRVLYKHQHLSHAYRLVTFQSGIKCIKKEVNNITGAMHMGLGIAFIAHYVDLPQMDVSHELNLWNCHLSEGGSRWVVLVCGLLKAARCCNRPLDILFISDLMPRFKKTSLFKIPLFCVSMGLNKFGYFQNRSQVFYTSWSFVKTSRRSHISLLQNIFKGSIL